MLAAIMVPQVTEFIAFIALFPLIQHQPAQHKQLQFVPASKKEGTTERQQWNGEKQNQKPTAHIDTTDVSASAAYS